MEHPPIYTAGTSAKDSDLLDARFPVFKTGRGGQYTYHGPGQRVAYVMLDLKLPRPIASHHEAKCKPDVRRFVRDLEEWLIATLAEFGVAGERREGRVGIWVARDGREDKIAAIGVRVRHWVTFHGVSLNVNPDLSHFAGIVPCGVRDAGSPASPIWDVPSRWPMSTPRCGAGSKACSDHWPSANRAPSLRLGRRESGGHYAARFAMFFCRRRSLCALAGMAWGMHMGMINDHSELPAHAHLNLIGWVGSAIYGTFFALNPNRFHKTSWAVFILNTVGVLVMIPSLAMVLASGDDPASPYVMPMIIGSMIVALAMVAFATAVFRRLFGPQT